jgi:hypothetical protein
MDPAIARSLTFVATGSEEQASEAEFIAWNAEVDRRVQAANAEKEMMG